MKNEINECSLEIATAGERAHQTPAQRLPRINRVPAIDVISTSTKRWDNIVAIAARAGRGRSDGRGLCWEVVEEKRHQAIFRLREAERLERRGQLASLFGLKVGCQLRRARACVASAHRAHRGENGVGEKPEFR